MPLSRTFAGELRRAAPVPDSRLWFVVVSCLATSVGFNFVLCFVDSSLVELNQSHVVASELVLISTALLLAGEKRAAIHAQSILAPCAHSC